ncbi:ImmA/IrrE family metallo-endopeptidase [Streptomyces sp. NPDC058745]|uniref:ImmA/IrrE family metallo-endopeptidase n=1 Tax=Streptomyces sp. NPDC058745 TaxID=3346621 RepID=UPI0036B2AE23
MIHIAIVATWQYRMGMNPALIERVREVIGRAGPTQAAQAERLGMSPDKLSKSLSGVRRFTSLELALLAEAAGTTVDWLISGREPRAAINVAARRNGEGASTQSDARAILARYENIIDALMRLGYALPKPRTSPSIADGAARAVDQGEQLAQVALEALGVFPSACTNEKLANLCEEAYGVQIASTELPDGLDGVAWAPKDFRLIVVAKTAKWTRQRFTLAHELGHVLAGDAQDIVVENLSPGIQQSLSEVRANAFAAAFLMPCDAVAKDAHGGMDASEIGRLSWKYRVSPSAMATRLKALKLIDAETRKEALGVTTREAAHTAGQLAEHLQYAKAGEQGWAPKVMSILATRAYLQGDLSVRPLASLWEVDPETLLDVLEPAKEPVLEPTAAETGLVFTP